MTITYLIKYREKPSIPSKRWLTVWVKRILTFPGLMRILWSAWYCRLRGGKVGVLTIIEGTPLFGKISNLEIGNESFIARTVNLALHAPIIIGSKVVINAGVNILTASHFISDSNWGQYSKQIQIHDYAWIATNAIILPGVTIGRGAVVGAGAIVRADVPPGTVVSGNPAISVANRAEFLNYSPVNRSSPFEAWIGSGLSQANPKQSTEHSTRKNS